MRSLNEIEFRKLKKKGSLSEMHNFLRFLPKGGLLHVHLMGAIPVESILEHSAQLYVKTHEGGSDTRPKYSIITGREWNKLKFEAKPRKRGEFFRHYEPMNSLSKNALEEVREALLFRACAPLTDEKAPLLMPLYTPNPYALPIEFERKFTRLEGISADSRMTRHLLWNVLDAIWADNVEYLELMVNPFDKVNPTIESIRNAFGENSNMFKTLMSFRKDPDFFEYYAAVYNLRQYIDQVHAYNAHLFRRMSSKWPRCPVSDISREDLKHLPKQLKVRFLIGLNRSSIKRRERLDQAFQIVQSFREIESTRYRDYVAGINLIGDEFGLLGRPIDYLKWMIPLIKEYPDVHISLHAGESSVRDGHVLDSILLGAERIGHGISLEHSFRTKKVLKDRMICIEVCLLSNKILGFIPDVEAHPAKEWIEKGYKICLNTDDPGIFDTSLTEEFYYATMAFDLSLADIRRITLESLESSFMPRKEKIETIKKVARRFDKYVANYALS